MSTLTDEQIRDCFDCYKTSGPGRHRNDIAAAIIAAHEAAKQPPEGWKLVPLGPDANMIRAGDRAWLDLPRRECPTIRIYYAMLAAAPDQP